MTWTDEAACAGMAPDFDVPMAVVGRAGGRGTLHLFAEQAMVCARCPVRQECHDRAMADPTEHLGVYGGHLFPGRGQPMEIVWATCEDCGRALPVGHEACGPCKRARRYGRERVS